jgi:hypothetical protein
MKKFHRIVRKRSASAIAGSPIEQRDQDGKKPVRADSPPRDQPPARVHTESPRGSTIPPYPKVRIDD